MADLEVNEGLKFGLTQLPIQKQAEVVQNLAHQKYLMDWEREHEEVIETGSDIFDEQGFY